jgi:6-pyruvoyltetrahydropterin/6-carboxytetrahydropterin synthase
MLQITKIFRFEMAHAIHGYPGKCKDIHGHSYELHVTVASHDKNKNFLPGAGLVIDFRELKHIVNDGLVRQLDHKLVLSGDFMKAHSLAQADNLLQWEHEPSAENILVYIQRLLREKMPQHIRLIKLKLFETNDSYAEWINIE